MKISCCRPLFFATLALVLLLLSACGGDNTPAQVTPTVAPPTSTPEVAKTPTVTAMTTPTSSTLVSPERITQAKKIIEQMK